MPKWYEGPMCGFDTETTGPDPMTARIVTASVGYVAGVAEGFLKWTVAVDVDIPEAAAAIHGFTTKRARAEGKPLAEVLPQIVAALKDGWESGPVIAYNASYDLTILLLELERLGLPRPELGPVVDPMVIDRHVDKWRSGKRRLSDVAAHYGVKVDQAHDAGADALTAMRVAWQIGKRGLHAPGEPSIGDMTLADLHAAQVGWAREQRASLQEYLRGKDPDADPPIVVDLGWPLTEAYTSGRR